MSAISNTIKPRGKTFDIRIGDSMLAFGIGIAIFFWFFNAMIRFLDSPDLGWKMILIGTELQFYEKLAASSLFIVFGSHVQTNIKKRRQAENDLHKSEEKYRIILESIEEGYYEINFDGNFQFVNQSMCALLARTEKEIIATNIFSHLDKKDVDEFNTFLTRIKKNENHFSTIECEVKIKGGGRKIIEISASLIVNFNFEAVGVKGIVRDVTEKKLLEKNLLKSLEDVKEARAGIILGLAKLAEYRDTDTGRHLERIREYSKVIAQKMSRVPEYCDYITSQYIEDIYQSSILHDIGKVGVPDAILLKKGKLTDEEYEKIKVHTLLGGQALSEITRQFKDQTFLTIAREIAYYHHEKWNGKGYPKQLKGEQIPLSARIIAIADVYDALTSKRCYKEAFPHTKAKKIILNEKGELFDPVVVDAFLAGENDFLAILKALHGRDKDSNPIRIHKEYDVAKL
jgi:PAS domain S-box-containing protein